MQPETEESIKAKKIVDELVSEGIKLRKEVRENMLIKCIDLTKVKPGEKYDASKYFLDIANKNKQLSERVSAFKVSLFLRFRPLRGLPQHIRP